MIKKAALIIFTFSALVGAHLAYVQGFDFLARQMAMRSQIDDELFKDFESESAVRSKQLAQENFGTDHFTTKNVKLTYYDQSRGSYMYAQEYVLTNAGKTMEITPFAMISVSKDGKSHKTVTSNKAIIVFNQPYGLLKKSLEPQRVIHAELIGDVRIRDDKGTADNSADDMRIGPMTRVEFDEKTMQITTKSDVVIQDQDMIITGTEMMIQLRRKLATQPGAAGGGSPAPAPSSGKSSGFEAETAFLYKNVHIVINNVTPNGILPGQSKPDARGQTPLDLRCAGEMRIDMPKPHVEAAVGPQNPFRDPEPTYARFEKNVRVIRGAITRDQLNCDKLNLTLKPDKKTPESLLTADQPAAAVAAADSTTPPAATGGPMTQLKLRTALAQGDAVWIQSESQGLRARCTELKYDKKLEEGLPDKTYLNGGSKRKLWVEKTELVSEGPKAGSIKSIMQLDAIDTEILDYGNGGNNRIVARGPGRSEERPSRNESVTHVAYFENEMILVTTREAPKPGAGGVVDPAAPLAPLRRVVTLTGPSKLVDYTSSSTLDAKEKIVAEFESGPKTGAGNGGDGPSRIKWLQAFDNAHLTTPGRTLTAWRKFEAWFVQPAPQATPAATTPVAVAGNDTAVVPGPVAANGPGETPLEEAKPDAPPPPVEGAVDGRANFVHATIVQGAGNAKGELREAYLRGDVMVHQDPNPGELFGKNASGQALDLFNQGKGMMKFAVATEEPQSNNAGGKTKLAAGSDGARSKLASKSRTTSPKALARVEFDGKVIESEKIIGLDQQANFAWSLGHGSLVQMADQSLLDDKGLASDKSKPKGTPGPSVREPMKIYWNEEMRFYGRSVDKQGREVAKAEFRGSSEDVQTPDGKTDFRRGVMALMKESAVYCDMMDVYMDKTIDFSKAKTPAAGSNPTDSAAKPKENEPQAEIAMMECWGDNLVENKELIYAGVDITSVKFFPETKILRDKYRIRHTHVIYDKRTGDFEGSGPGVVFLYQGNLPKNNTPVVRTTAATTKGRSIETPSPTLKLTKIQFTELMKGRMGISREGVPREARVGEFVGNVQTANAIVRGAGSDLNFDKLDRLPDAVFLTSDVLRVRSEPASPADEKAPDHQLLFASGNAAVRTVDRLIQGDRITYDSGTELMYAYGDDEKRVVLVEQQSPGQPASRTYGRSLRGNKLTREFEMVDPQTIQIYDLKTGSRPKAAYPDLGGSPKKPEIPKQKRMPFQRPARNSTERNGFTGGN